MESNLVHTLVGGERVSSSYAEIYLPDAHCDNDRVSSLSLTASKTATKKMNLKLKTSNIDNKDDLWTSPSDVLIGHVELSPPFTSKITRGKTHQGILSIGNEKLQSEHEQFMERMTKLLDENDSAWSIILEHEKNTVYRKVKEIYDNIFREKTYIMHREIDAFYEATLQEVEENMKSQVDDILISTYANVISNLNNEIEQKLAKEKKVAESQLNQKYQTEVAKIKHYYKLLLQNEVFRNKKLINQAMNGRNDAVKAFLRHTEAENITSTMYVLCMERKKCKIKQFILKNYQSAEIAHSYNKVKEYKHFISDYQSKHQNIAKINSDWEEKIHKILKIFLKFISFSLKLLPEQSTFLLDLQKMMVLQLNEIQKTPTKASSILINEENFKNLFEFEEFPNKENDCKSDPFVIVGDLSDDVPRVYGSRETLPPEVDLPYLRLEGQYEYVKCHRFEQIKTLLEVRRCTCKENILNEQQSPSTASCSLKDIDEEELLPKKESSNELFVTDDFHRLSECPGRLCKVWTQRFSFPYLNAYLDFNEENYTRVRAILGKTPVKDPVPELVEASSRVFSELPFSATKEPFHTVQTQYSIQEDIYVPDIKCPCLDGYLTPDHEESSMKPDLNDILTKRKLSLRRLLQQNPNLLNLFTDESFDFVF